MLRGKKIVVGISGGIAAYKIPEFIRLLKKAGAEVKVTTTGHALEFVTPLVLQTLSENAVYTDVFASRNEHSTEHISLPDWADMMVVAPATANILGKMANGIADDALSTTFLAMQKPVLIAPAMNEKMLAHPATQRNLETLRTFRHCTILDAAEGFLACGTTGKGRMQEIDVIFEAVCDILTKKDLVGKNVMITAGPTREKIDPVRYISNYSTGKMGISLAVECARRGAEVTLITGPTAPFPQLSKQALHPIRCINTESANEMYEAAKSAFPTADIAILCAAVADYRPAEQATVKMKREGKGDITLDLTQNPDIAASLGAIKRDDQTLVGFALETNNEEQNALGKMVRKHLDMIVLNSLQDKGAGFGTDTNKVTILHSNGTKNRYPLMDKSDVAKTIIDELL